MKGFSKFPQIWAKTCCVAFHNSMHSREALFDLRALNMSVTLIQSNYTCVFTGLQVLIKATAQSSIFGCNSHRKLQENPGRTE